MQITEQPSLYDNLEKKSVREILEDINREDQKVALAVQKAIPQIEQLVNQIVPRMKQGGRIFYMGAGTSGRLGVLDASEIPPTFGMPPYLDYRIDSRWGYGPAQSGRRCRGRYEPRMGRAYEISYQSKRYSDWHCRFGHYSLCNRCLTGRPASMAS